MDPVNETNGLKKVFKRSQKEDGYPMLILRILSFWFIKTDALWLPYPHSFLKDLKWRAMANGYRSGSGIHNFGATLMATWFEELCKRQQLKGFNEPLLFSKLLLYNLSR